MHVSYASNVPARFPNIYHSLIKISALPGLTGCSPLGLQKKSLQI